MDLAIKKAATEGESSVWSVAPGWLLFWVLALHMLAWTIVPSLLNQNLPLDLIEELTWGREWQWGYDKHPPLSAWMMEGVAWLTGGADWGQYFLAQVCVVLSFVAAWFLAREFVDADRALLAVLLLEGIYFYNFTTPELNANVALHPFWSLTLLMFWRGYRYNRLIDWGLCGCFAAAAFLSKYFAAILFLPLVVFLLLDRRGRTCIKSKGFYFGAVLFLLLLVPHLVWVVNNGFTTLQYGLTRAGVGDTIAIINHVKNPLKFLLNVAFVSLPMLGLFYAIGRPDWRWKKRQSSEDLFLWLVLLGPLVTVLVLSLLTGMRLRSMWAYPLFFPVGILLVSHFAADVSEWKIPRFAKAFGIVCSLFLLIYGGIQGFSPLFKEKGKRTHFPGKALAAEVLDLWQQKSDLPLRYIGGDLWLAGNAAWYSGLPQRPSVAIDMDIRRAPWVTDQEIRVNGGVILWDMGSATTPKKSLSEEKLTQYRRRFGPLILGDPINLDWGVGGMMPPVVVGWGIVLPAER